ncbi:MAG: HD domain-containing protein [Thermoguttaceae bacterium]|nr:HD domain-containing protein [Thermoguttaceae bacterium]
MEQKPKIKALADLVNNQEGVVFAALAAKDEGRTRDGKPYYRLTFQDARRRAQAMIWRDSSFYDLCREEWRVGDFFKIRLLYKESDYGPKIEIRQIRKAVESDEQEGFSPNLCRPATPVDPSIYLDELLSLAKERVGKGPLLTLIQRIFKENRQRLLSVPSSRGHHHTVFGGMLEHTVTVTKIAIALIDRFRADYPAGAKLFSPPLTVAGAILHEIGKIDQMRSDTLSPTHTLAGELIGYPVLGRDIVRRHAQEAKLPPDLLLRLEHILLAHPVSPDWGAALGAMSLEAAIVQLADYSDSIFATSLRTILGDRAAGDFTLARGPLGQPLLKNIPPTSNNTNAGNN